MANGFHGSRKDWNQLEAPLLLLDPHLQIFEQRHGIPIRRNSHNNPERAFEWGAPIRRLIQIFSEDEDCRTWNLWICASEDRGGSRYWKHSLLKSRVTVNEMLPELPQLLEKAMTVVESWTSDQLEYAGSLR